MSRPTWSQRLFVAAVLGFGYTLGAVAPASAQDMQETPWYLPQAWVHPVSRGSHQSAQYGDSFRKAYGSFSRACYGSCWIVRGTIATGNGVVLFRPKQAVYDQRSAEIQLNRYLAQLQQASARRNVHQYPPAQPIVVAVHNLTATSKPPLQISVQNGVRVIRPAPQPAKRSVLKQPG
jgi:hypothetical protein